MSSPLELFESRFLNPPDPSHPAIIHGGHELSYAALNRKAASLLAHFESKGLRPGDRVAILLQNSPEFILCYLACLLGRFTAIPINRALPQKDIQYILEISRPALVIENADELQFPDSEPIRSVRTSDDDIFGIFFTSGTTGRPKGICHSTGRTLANAAAFNDLVGIDTSIRMMHVMPMGYMAGFLNTVLCPLLAGGTVVIAPQFNAMHAMSFWRPAMENGTNAVWITPTMAAFLTRLNRGPENSEWTRKNMRHVFVGTAPLPLVIRESFEGCFGVKCLESYGMTEVMFVSGNSLLFDVKDRSAGRLLEGVEIEARDDSGNALAKGADGHLFIRSPFALKGYLDPEIGEVSVTKADWWLDTGDSGYLDEDGYLFITGRTKDILIHGGINVSPMAVEETLLRHPDIEDAAVVGKPHPFWGDEVVAFVIMAGGKEFDKEAITAYCRENLPPDAVPTLFRVLEDFPRSSTGKVQKHLMRESL